MQDVKEEGLVCSERPKRLVMLDENVNRTLYVLCFVSLFVRTGQIPPWKDSVNE